MDNLLSEVFNPQAIKLDIDGKTKEMVFAELIDEIITLHPECDRDQVLSSAKEREEKMNTGIGSGVAIPRAVCRGIDKFAGAIGVSQHGIDYGALDGKPVHVIFLLAMNECAQESHLHIIDLIFKLAQSNAITLIKEAKSAEEIQAVLSCSNYLKNNYNERSFYE